MKIQKGFNATEAKERALDQADQEEQEGCAHPLTPSFTPDQFKRLRRITAELETIRENLAFEPSKADDYAGELEQILDDVQTLPHRDTYSDLIAPMEGSLQEAQEAARQGDAERAFILLKDVTKFARVYLRVLEGQH